MNGQADREKLGMAANGDLSQSTKSIIQALTLKNKKKAAGQPA